MLVKHMSQGYSFISFAAIVDVCEDTVYEWAKVHEEFSEAKKRGLVKNRLVTEKTLVDGANGRIPGFNATAAIFALKNRFPHEWRDRTEVAQSGEVTIKMTEDDREALIDKFLDARTPKE